MRRSYRDAATIGGAESLRPGHYIPEVRVDGAHASVPLEVYNHVRESSFKLIDWGSRASGEQQRVLGSMGFKLLYPSYGGLDPGAIIRGGKD
ncbi:MAG TPA: hypothetical protein VFJ58_28825 [Armatimonadota bacterium]|nr:hypothetical protein [Armatimonadota bacterium]